MQHPLLTKKIKFWLLSLLLSSGLLFKLGVVGCGSVSPPVSLPAPVANLMVINPPDNVNTVIIQGLPGAVLPGALVFVANNTQGVFLSSLESLFYGVAWAAPLYDTETVADSEGAFRISITARVNDTIEVSQSLDGENSPSIKLVVSDSITTGGASVPQ